MSWLCGCCTYQHSRLLKTHAGCPGLSFSEMAVVALKHSTSVCSAEQLFVLDFVCWLLVGDSSCAPLFRQFGNHTRFAGDSSKSGRCLEPHGPALLHVQVCAARSITACQRTACPVQPNRAVFHWHVLCFLSPLLALSCLVG
jgi:hypothetical protein